MSASAPLARHGEPSTTLTAMTTRISDRDRAPSVARRRPVAEQRRDDPRERRGQDHDQTEPQEAGRLEAGDLGRDRLGSNGGHRAERRDAAGRPSARHRRRGPSDRRSGQAPIVEQVAGPRSIADPTIAPLDASSERSRGHLPGRVRGARRRTASASTRTSTRCAVRDPMMRRRTRRRRSGRRRTGRSRRGAGR